MEPPDALPEMPVSREPYLLERRTASTCLDPDSTKLAVEVDAFAVDEARVLADVRRFVDAYVATHPTSANRVRFLEYDSL